MNRLLAVDAFEEAGFEVVDFGRADDALSYTQAHPDDVSALFTDIDVPGDRDGIELAMLFSKRWPQTFVLVTSGCFGEGVPMELPNSVRYIAKPWRAKALIGLLQDGLNSQSTRIV